MTQFLEVIAEGKTTVIAIAHIILIERYLDEIRLQLTEKLTVTITNDPAAYDKIMVTLNKL